MGWENKLCVVTCFGRGHFVPSDALLGLVGCCFRFTIQLLQSAHNLPASRVN